MDTVNNTVDTTDFGVIDCKDRHPDEVAREFDIMVFRTKTSLEGQHEKLYGAKVVFVNATPSHVASIMCYAISHWRRTLHITVQFKDMNVDEPDFDFSHYSY